MRFSSRPLLLLTAAGLAAAGPFPRDNLHDAGFSYLMPRGCDSYCGADNQYCCSSGETCTTVNDVASCVGGDGSYYGAYTTTWTETHTYTSTIMTLWDSAPEATAGVDCVPQNTQQEACGTICCAGWQTCAFQGQCSAKPGMEGGTTVVVTSNGKVTTQYSAPYRITGTTTVTTESVRSDTITETGSATSTSESATSTATSDNDTIGAGGTGGHLSAGAIAGIVIGTLAGVAFLLLLCFCCIARGLWVAIFGKKKNESRERVDITEERYSRHGSRPPTAHSRRSQHKGWFGGGGGPSSAGTRRDEKKSSGAKWLGLAGLAATLLALLNLRKDKRPSSKPSRSSRGSSRYSDSYYSYSDYDDPSSVSSRSRRTRRTTRTRDSRGTYYSRPSRQ